MQGFTHEVAILAVSSTGFKSLTAALDFINGYDAEGKCLHSFAPLGKNEELCFICLRGKSCHRESEDRDETAMMDRQESNVDVAPGKRLKRRRYSFDSYEKEVQMFSKMGIDVSKNITCGVCYNET